MQEGHFRQDLLYRINTIEIIIPPLRERENDVTLLARHFLQRYCQKYKKEIDGFSDEAYQLLKQYNWPGNVRELQHVIERAVILSETRQLQYDDFMLRLPVSNSQDKEGKFNLEELEKNTIQEVLHHCSGNMTQAASLLGITRTSLYRRIGKIQPMKRYTKKAAGLIFLLLATSVTFGLLVAFQFYISAIVTFALILFEGYYLFHMMERSDRLFKQFIWSIRYSDFLASGTPLQKQNDKIPQDMVKVMEEALQHYKKHLQEKESQLQYFQALANHIDLSVFVYSCHRAGRMDEPSVQDTNGSELCRNDRRSGHLSSGASRRLHTLHPGELSILQVRRKDEYSQLILSAISFVVLGKPLTVVSMKNIRSVLENKETEAWQKLIRVLTHEIMNSMTPIVSLSELLRNKCMDEPGVDTEDREEINQAVETIFRRSSGLVRFVESYRKVTGIPMPIPEIIPVNHFLDNISLLFKDQKDKIKIVPATAHLQVIADKGLIDKC